MTALAQGRPCRCCARLTWLADATGPAHTCCAYWAQREPGKPCRACRASDALARGKRRKRTQEPT
jgi:hypothetical protein